MSPNNPVPTRRPATIKDICARTGFSVATVSRALNNKPKVSKYARETIATTIQKLGYKPNAIARMLSRKQTDIIGVVLHQMTSGFYASVMCGIDFAAREHHLHMLSAVAYQDQERNTYYDMLSEARVDGLIVVDPTLDRSVISQLKSYRRPIVLVQKTLTDPFVATVNTNDEEAACATLRHMLKKGYRDLLLVLGTPEPEDNHRRLNGCKKALAEYGLSMRNVRTITGYYSAAETVKVFRKYRAETQTLPRAIFAFNDDMALAIMKELRLAGIRVPEDIAIAGFDGIDASDYVGLTTVKIPMIEMGKEAVRILAARIAKPNLRAPHLVLKSKLLPRESTGHRSC